MGLEKWLHCGPTLAMQAILLATAIALLENSALDLPALGV